MLSVHSHMHSLLLPVALKPNIVFRIGLAYFNKFDNNSFIIALAFSILAPPVDNFFTHLTKNFIERKRCRIDFIIGCILVVFPSL